jgi:hypothetical protein
MFSKEYVRLDFCDFSKGKRGISQIEEVFWDKRAADPTIVSGPSSKMQFYFLI